VPVALHPSSVNAKANRFESKYLVYAEMVSIVVAMSVN